MAPHQFDTSYSPSSSPSSSRMECKIMDPLPDDELMMDRSSPRTVDQVEEQTSTSSTSTRSADEPLSMANDGGDDNSNSNSNNSGQLVPPSPSKKSSGLRRKSRPWRVDALLKKSTPSSSSSTRKSTTSWKAQMQERKALYEGVAVPEQEGGGESASVTTTGSSSFIEGEEASFASRRNNKEQPQETKDDGDEQQQQQSAPFNLFDDNVSVGTISSIPNKPANDEISLGGISIEDDVSLLTMSSSFAHEQKEEPTRGNIDTMVPESSSNESSMPFEIMQHQSVLSSLEQPNNNYEHIDVEVAAPDDEMFGLFRRLSKPSVEDTPSVDQSVDLDLSLPLPMVQESASKEEEEENGEDDDGWTSRAEMPLLDVSQQLQQEAKRPEEILDQEVEKTGDEMVNDARQIGENCVVSPEEDGTMNEPMKNAVVEQEEHVEEAASEEEEEEEEHVHGDDDDDGWLSRAAMPLQDIAQQLQHEETSPEDIRDVDPLDVETAESSEGVIGDPEEDDTTTEPAQNAEQQEHVEEAASEEEEHFNGDDDDDGWLSRAAMPLEDIAQQLQHEETSPVDILDPDLLNVEAAKSSEGGIEDPEEDDTMTKSAQNAERQEQAEKTAAEEESDDDDGWLSRAEMPLQDVAQQLQHGEESSENIRDANPPDVETAEDGEGAIADKPAANAERIDQAEKEEHSDDDGWLRRAEMPLQDVAKQLLEQEAESPEDAPYKEADETDAGEVVKQEAVIADPEEDDMTTNVEKQEHLEAEPQSIQSQKSVEPHKEDEEAAAVESNVVPQTTGSFEVWLVAPQKLEQLEDADIISEPRSEAHEDAPCYKSGTEPHAVENQESAEPQEKLGDAEITSESQANQIHETVQQKEEAGSRSGTEPTATEIPEIVPPKNQLEITPFREANDVEVPTQDAIFGTEPPVETQEGLEYSTDMGDSARKSLLMSEMGEKLHFFYTAECHSLEASGQLDTEDPSLSSAAEQIQTGRKPDPIPAQVKERRSSIMGELNTRVSSVIIDKHHIISSSSDGGSESSSGDECKPSSKSENQPDVEQSSEEKPVEKPVPEKEAASKSLSTPMAEEQRRTPEEEKKPNNKPEDGEFVGSNEASTPVFDQENPLDPEEAHPNTSSEITAPTSEEQTELLTREEESEVEDNSIVPRAVSAATNQEELESPTKADERAAVEKILQSSLAIETDIIEEGDADVVGEAASYNKTVNQGEVAAEVMSPANEDQQAEEVQNEKTKSRKRLSGKAKKWKDRLARKGSKTKLDVEDTVAKGDEAADPELGKEAAFTATSPPSGSRRKMERRMSKADKWKERLAKKKDHGEKSEVSAIDKQEANEITAKVETEFRPPNTNSEQRTAKAAETSTPQIKDLPRLQVNQAAKAKENTTPEIKDLPRLQVKQVPVRNMEKAASGSPRDQLRSSFNAFDALLESRNTGLHTSDDFSCITEYTEHTIQGSDFAVPVVGKTDNDLRSGGAVASAKGNSGNDDSFYDCQVEQVMSPQKTWQNANQPPKQEQQYTPAQSTPVSILTAKLSNNPMLSDARPTLPRLPTITVQSNAEDDMTQITFDQTIEYYDGDSYDAPFPNKGTPASVHSQKTETTKESVTDENGSSARTTEGGSSHYSRASKQRVTELLRKELFSQDTSVVQSAMEKLVKEASFGSRTRSNILRYGGLLAVLRTMEVNQKKAGVATAACRALEKFALDSSSQVAIGEMGGIPDIIGIMKEHVKRIQVQRAACAALANISQCCQVANTKNHYMSIPTNHVVPALCMCMMRYSKDGEIQMNGFVALANFCLDNQDRLKELSQAGGITAMTMALQKPWKSKTKKHEAISSLSILLRGLTEQEDTDDASDEEEEEDGLEDLPSFEDSRENEESAASGGDASPSSEKDEKEPENDYPKVEQDTTEPSEAKDYSETSELGKRTEDEKEKEECIIQ